MQHTDIHDDDAESSAACHEGPDRGIQLVGHCTLTGTKGRSPHPPSKVHGRAGSGCRAEREGSPDAASRSCPEHCPLAHSITSPLFGPRLCPVYRLPPGSLASSTAVGATSKGSPMRFSGSPAMSDFVHSSES